MIEKTVKKWKSIKLVGEITDACEEIVQNSKETKAKWIWKSEEISFNDLRVVKWVKSEVDDDDDFNPWRQVVAVKFVLHKLNFTQWRRGLNIITSKLDYFVQHRWYFSSQVAVLVKVRFKSEVRFNSYEKLTHSSPKELSSYEIWWNEIQKIQMWYRTQRLSCGVWSM